MFCVDVGVGVGARRRSLVRDVVIYAMVVIGDVAVRRWWRLSFPMWLSGWMITFGAIRAWISLVSSVITFLDCLIAFAGIQATISRFLYFSIHPIHP